MSSIRVRLTLSALIVVAIVLSAVGGGLIYLQYRTIVGGQQSRVSAEAGTVALALSQSRSIDNLAKPGTGLQVVDPSGHVLYATEGLLRQPAVSSIHPAPGSFKAVRLTNQSLSGDDGIAIVEATSVRTPQGVLTVYAVAYGTQLEQSQRSLIVGLFLGMATVLAVTGWLIWTFTGRALRPVEQMRSEVESLAEHNLDERVEVPSGDDEITRLARTLNDLLERLELAQSAQRAFISDASHELRSPLASLLTTVEVARAHPDRADWPAVASVVADEGERLRLLVDDLLLLAAHDEHREPRRDVAVDLDEIVLAEAQRLRLQGGPSIDTSRVSAARVSGDPVLLARAVRNLVDNAVRHATSTISFAVSLEVGWAVIDVSDDGPGVAPHDAVRLFERFARSDEARDRPSGGAGLGLAIVAELVALHGGSVAFLDVDQGATAEIRLPSAIS